MVDELRLLAEHIHSVWIGSSTRNTYSFRCLASKGFPDGYSTGGCACVCPLSQKLRTYEVVFANDD